MRFRIVSVIALIVIIGIVASYLLIYFTQIIIPLPGPICNDPDSGLNYDIQSNLTYTQTIVFNESTNPDIIKVISLTDANLKFGDFNNLVKAGESYKFIQKDETYIIQGQRGILRNVPTEINVKKIKYYGDNNKKNSVEIEMRTTNIDECASVYINDTKGLIENSCTRQIDEYYNCPNNCTNGRCL